VGLPGIEGAVRGFRYGFLTRAADIQRSSGTVPYTCDPGKGGIGFPAAAGQFFAPPLKPRFAGLFPNSVVISIAVPFLAFLFFAARLPYALLILKTAVEASGIRQLAERQAVVQKAIVTGTVKCEAVDLRYRSLTFGAR
jgi:hypothetical protein